MTLDEAIEHAKSVARTCNDSQCAADHLQLAEWLRTARGAEKAGRYFTRDIRELKSKLQDVERENVALRVQLADVTESIGRMEERCAKLRELLRIVVNKYCDSGTCDGCPILGKDESCPY